MKLQYLLCGFCLAGLLAVAACGKHNAAPSAPQPMEIQGVKVDLPQLKASLLTASPEVQGAINEAYSNLRYGLYVKAMMSMDKIASDSSLTDEQKKLTAQVMDELKQVVAKAPPQPGQ